MDSTMQSMTYRVYGANGLIGIYTARQSLAKHDLANRAIARALIAEPGETQCYVEADGHDFACEIYGRTWVIADTKERLMGEADALRLALVVATTRQEASSDA